MSRPHAYMLAKCNKEEEVTSASKGGGLDQEINKATVEQNNAPATVR